MNFEVQFKDADTEEFLGKGDHHKITNAALIPQQNDIIVLRDDHEGSRRLKVEWREFDFIGGNLCVVRLFLGAK